MKRTRKEIRTYSTNQMTVTKNWTTRIQNCSVFLNHTTPVNNVKGDSKTLTSCISPSITQIRQWTLTMMNFRMSRGSELTITIMWSPVTMSTTRDLTKTASTLTSLKSFLSRGTRLKRTILIAGILMHILKKGHSALSQVRSTFQSGFHLIQWK